MKGKEGRREGGREGEKEGKRRRKRREKGGKEEGILRDSSLFFPHLNDSDME